MERGAGGIGGLRISVAVFWVAKSSLDVFGKLISLSDIDLRDAEFDSSVWVFRGIDSQPNSQRVSSSSSEFFGPFGVPPEPFPDGHCLTVSCSAGC